MQPGTHVMRETGIVLMMSAAFIFFFVPLFWICLGWWTGWDIPFTGAAKKRQ
jgi:hypothetical protein